MSTTAANRYFRCYERHCVSPDADTLFQLLGALHSLNDRLRKETEVNLFALAEFTALKALRNFFHHQGELQNEIRVVKVADIAAISTDLLFLCLVPGDLVEHAISAPSGKLKAQEQELARRALKWHGGVVNINPAIFNLTVRIFELVIALDLPVTADAFEMLKESYEFESDQGLSHFVTGDIICHARSVQTVLSTLFQNLK